MRLLFALAQVADAGGDVAEAAACLEPANALAREMRRSRGQTYSADEHSRYIDRLIEAFTPELFTRLAGMGDESARPVFVFGLPRSGTTLVEQLLASHSQVYGAGELPLARRAMDGLPVSPDKPDDMLAALAALDRDSVARLAADYQAGVDARVVGEEASLSNVVRIVDKMPDNYLYLGLLSILFPKARLIYVRRDERDVAVSCWMTHFRSIRWADSSDDLARRIVDHRRLMNHWQVVLPRPFHEVRYDRLIDDFETEARRLVAACDLPWEPACLRFHETSRPVRTASVTQVRQPLYRKSLNRWQAYEPHLAAMFARLPDSQ